MTICKIQSIMCYIVPCVLADRRFWQNDDPFLVSESLFGIANVISYTRLSYLLAVSEIFGPLQITLVKLTKVCYYSETHLIFDFSL